MRNLFNEPKDTALARIVQFGLLLLMFLILFWFVNPDNVPMSEPAWKIAILDILLVLLTIPMAAMDIMIKRQEGKVFGIYSYGTFTRLAISITVAYFLVFLMILIPHAFFGESLTFYGSLQWYTELGIYGLAQYFFVADVQPFVEEITRFFLVPTFTAILYHGSRNAGRPLNKFICAFISIFFISSPFFAWVHWGVLGQDISQAIMVYIYGCFFSIMNYILGSCAFSIMYHKLHNTYGYLITYGIPDVPVWFFILELGFFVVSLALVVVGISLIIKRRRFT